MFQIPLQLKKTKIKLNLTDKKKNKTRERIFTVKILDVLYQAAVYRFHLSILEAAQFCQTKEKVNEWKQKRKHTDLFFRVQ